MFKVLIIGVIKKYCNKEKESLSDFWTKYRLKVLRLHMVVDIKKKNYKKLQEIRWEDCEGLKVSEIFQRRYSW